MGGRIFTVQDLETADKSIETSRQDVKTLGWRSNDVPWQKLHRYDGDIMGYHMMIIWWGYDIILYLIGLEQLETFGSENHPFFVQLPRVAIITYNIYARIFALLNKWIYIYRYIHTDIYIYIHINIYIYTIYLYIYNNYIYIYYIHAVYAYAVYTYTVHMHIHLHTHIHMQLHIHVHTHIHMHIYIAYIYTYICIYIYFRPEIGWVLPVAQGILMTGSPRYTAAAR